VTVQHRVNDRQTSTVVAVGVGTQLMLDHVTLEVGDLADFQDAVFGHSRSPCQLAAGLVVVLVGQQDADVADDAAHDGFVDVIGEVVLVRLAEVSFHRVAQGVERTGNDLLHGNGQRVGGVEESKVGLCTPQGPLNLLFLMGDDCAVVHLGAGTEHRDDGAQRDERSGTSMLGVFKEIFADIGDEQSIEQSLSTFSAHMVNTVNILEKADSDSLVLFDELGAGTDPVEGAALGISILSFLKNIGARTMATTHYSELKLFALSTEGVQNASCEFDVETLRPTYRLLIGIPGKSNAFAISKKLGLPDYIIGDAKSRIDSDNEQFEDVLAELEQSRRQIDKDKETIAVYKSQIASLKKDYEHRTKVLEEKRDKIINKAKEEALDILKEAKETADETIKNINKYGNSGNTRELEKSRSNVGAKIKKNQKISSMKTAMPSKTYKPSDFKLGTGVKVLTMNLNGTVASLPNAHGDLTVKMGILNSKVNIKDLEIIDEPDIKAPGFSRGSSGKIKMNKSMNVKMEINLIGKTVDEALFALEKYLDDAYIARLPQVYIIHGKGTGALRNAIQNYLKSCSYVKSYRNGEHGEGGAGATVVEFK